jgi:U3 small nucleolar RNA-associated protein 11
MKRNLHGIGVPVKRKHIVFVDTEEEAKSFDAAEHFDTEPELVNRTFNRPRRAQLEEEDAVVGMRSDSVAGSSSTGTEISMKRLTRMQKGAYKTYTAYDERAKKLKDMSAEMAMQKIISHSKGHKVKITKENPDGTKTSYFKWKQERQK